MNQKSIIARLFNIAISTFFCLTLAVTSGYAQPGERLSAAAKADFQKGDYNLCLSEYTALISAAAQNDSFYAERSRCHYFKSNDLKTKSGDHTVESDAEITLALADAQKALDLNANNTAALNVRGNVKNYKNDEKAAIADFSRVIEIDPKFYKAYYNRALGKDRLKDYEGAIADYTKVIELNPQIPLVYADRGDAYFKFGKDAEAITDYTKAIELNPKSAAHFYRRGNALYFSKKYSEAIVDFDKAIALTPNYSFAYMGRGRSRAALDKKTEAIADLTKAIELDPNNKQAVDALARLNGTAATSTTSTNCISGNCVNGFGKYIFPNGDIYEGNYVNEKKEGQGTYTIKDGDVYTGQFANGKFDGQGTYTYKSGNVYTGQFAKGDINGQGTYSYKNGDVYVGQFTDGKFNGYGKRNNNSTNTVQQGIWKDNAFVRSAASAAAAELLPLPTDTLEEKQIKAQIALVVFLPKYQAARASYESAVNKYNRNVDGSPVMATLMPGTMNRASTQLEIMRTLVRTLLKDYGEFLPADDYKHAKKIYDDLPLTPSGN